MEWNDCNCAIYNYTFTKQDATRFVGNSRSELLRNYSISRTQFDFQLKIKRWAGPGYSDDLTLSIVDRSDDLLLLFEIWTKVKAYSLRVANICVR